MDYTQRFSCKNEGKLTPALVIRRMLHSSSQKIWKMISGPILHSSGFFLTAQVRLYYSSSLSSLYATSPRQLLSFTVSFAETFCSFCELGGDSNLAFFGWDLILTETGTESLDCGLLPISEGFCAQITESHPILDTRSIYKLRFHKHPQQPVNGIYNIALRCKSYKLS
jgi:hypothetical protein